MRAAIYRTDHADATTLADTLASILSGSTVTPTDHQDPLWCEVSVLVDGKVVSRVQWPSDKDRDPTWFRYQARSMAHGLGQGATVATPRFVGTVREANGLPRNGRLGNQLHRRKNDYPVPSPVDVGERDAGND